MECRFYFADILRTHAENAAKSQLMHGEYYETRLADLLHPKRANPAKDKTGGEIAADVVKRLGLQVISR